MKYINRDTGELLTHSEMKRQFREEYDGDDDTNPITYDEIYTPVVFDMQCHRWLYVVDKTVTHFICSTSLKTLMPMIYLPKAVTTYD